MKIISARKGVFRSKVYLLLGLIFFLSVMVNAAGCGRIEQFTRSSSTGTDSLQYADFTDQMVEERKGQVVIEVPPAYELMQIALSLTRASQQQPYRYTHPETAYYQQVQDHFGPFRDHELIKTLDDTIRNPTSYRAIFDHQITPDGLVPSSVYQVDHLSGAFQTSLDLLKEFAVETDFEDFYTAHQPYYQDQIQRYQEIVPVRGIWEFLEVNFSTEIDSVRIVLSPLMVGTNNTIKFVDREQDFYESLLFVPSPNVIQDHPSIPAEAADQVLTRSMFTEIDHNYVNPATDQYLEEIDRAMRRLSDWHTGSGYTSPAEKFNEYFTWAVFFPWAKQYYSPQDYQDIYQITMERMQYRGFIRFEAFTQELLRQVDLHPEKTLEEHMPVMIQWMKAQ